MFPRLSRCAVALAAASVAILAAVPAAAQPAGPGRSCTLTLQPTDSTESVSRKDAGEEDYVTYLWNGMTWLCGPATMTADSAVQYESRQQVVMVGSVHYRDTIRDLRSRRLTYYRQDDRVVAEDSVRLRQLETDAVLRGPRVEFYNAVRSDRPQRTVATRRPRVRIPSPGDTAGAPLRMTADTVIFLGERAAETFGDVRLRRGSLTARGGYGYFRIGEGSGYLTRSPVVEGEQFTLAGDTIRVGFEGTELRTVRAVGGGHLEAEEVDVRAARVDVRVDDEQVEEMWAYGDGASRALSAEQEIRGDSLHFDFAGGRLTEIAAVGDALAVETRPSEPGRDARSGADSDSARGGVADSTVAAPSGAAAPAALGFDRSWIAGDTVRAAFTTADSAAASPAAADTARPTAGDTAPTGADSARNELERLIAAGGARSFYRIRRDSAESGTSTGPDADRAAGEGEARLARNYVIGDRITIRFRAGTPLSVHGTRAIGLFLEPVAMPDSAASDSAAADSLARDTAAAESDSVAADTAGPDASVPQLTAPAASVRHGRRFPGGPGSGTLPRRIGIIRTGGMIYE